MNLVINRQTSAVTQIELASLVNSVYDFKTISVRQIRVRTFWLHMKEIPILKTLLKHVIRKYVFK